MNRPHISAILIGHAEGPLVGISFRSLLDAVAVARRAGLEVEVIVVLDRPNPATAEALADAAQHGARVERVDLGDQGLARNRAVELATGEYLAFLDGDDLWSENWLVAAHALCRTDPGRVIAHPEVSWAFESNPEIFFSADQTDPAFDPSFLRVANCWDAFCVAPAEVYAAHPFTARALAEGVAHEDWHWHRATFAAGLVHRVAPDTIHFKRRRNPSQKAEARQHRALPLHSPFLEYGWAPDPD